MTAMTLCCDSEMLRILNSFENASVNKFDDRIRLQKLAFLARELGVADSGFLFSWYRHGPYSPGLTRMLFQASDLGELRTSRKPLAPNEAAIVEKVELLLGKDGVNDPRKLELYASVWYMLPGKITENAVKRAVQFLAEKKPKFSDAEVRRCIDEVKKFRQNHEPSA